MGFTAKLKKVINKMVAIVRLEYSKAILYVVSYYFFKIFKYIQYSQKLYLNFI